MSLIRKKISVSNAVYEEDTESEMDAKKSSYHARDYSRDR